MMIPGAGKEAIINVTGTLADGSKVSDKKVFRIKSLPDSRGMFRGEEKYVSGPKSSLEMASVGAKFPDDFDYDLPLIVTGFKFKVPGQRAISVSGNKLDQQCKSALAKVGKGEFVTFFDIETKVVGASVGVSSASDVKYEIK